VDQLSRFETYATEDASLVVVAYGFTGRSSLRAVNLARDRGYPVGLVRLVTIWPFDPEIISPHACRGARFLVPEMNMGQVAEMVRSAAGGAQVHTLNQVNGQTIAPARILERIQELL
jgi:2-oxoglutarate ferredoxin oxidoreductase subunit alpha